MNCTVSTEPETAAKPTVHAVRLPTGLLGFEQIKDYALATNPEEQPFMWLRVLDNSALAFVVIDPFIIKPDYLPDIPPADVDFLQLKKPEDALLLGIVTLNEGRQPTINLKAPVVLNRHTRIGKQVIIANANNYSVKHALPVDAA